jgi:hypothetical protein
MDLAAGNFAFTRKAALLADVLLVVVPAVIDDDVIENAYSQLKSLLSAYIKAQVTAFPQIVLVSNRAKFGNPFNASKWQRSFENAAKTNNWYRSITRQTLIAGAVDVPEIQDNLKNYLQHNDIPRKLEKPIGQIADILVSLPPSPLSTQERYTQVVVPYEQSMSGKRTTKKE